MPKWGPRAQWERLRTVRREIRATRAGTDDLAAAIAACREEVAACTARVDALSARAAADRERLLHALRVVRDDDAASRAKLWRLRDEPGYPAAFEDPDPLVTIIITTYRNWPLLRERSLPSVLAQTHTNFEAIVVGDAAPAEAEDAVRGFGDDRLRFVNLPYRGPYPTNPAQAWYVSGTTPFNTALALAGGQWIGSTSDDDALHPNYIETLVGLAREQRAEVAYGQLRQRAPDGADTLLGAFPPQAGQWGIQCSLIHAGLRFLPLQPTDWLFEIPNDWSLADRMLRIGVRFAMVEQPVVDYYPSHAWTDRLQRTEF